MPCGASTACGPGCGSFGSVHRANGLWGSSWSDCVSRATKSFTTCWEKVQPRSRLHWTGWGTHRRDQDLAQACQRNPQIQYDGERLLVNGHETDRDVLAQAQAQAGWLLRTLEESTGRRIPVQPVVVFPGWFVHASHGANAKVWVMEPKGLPAFLAHEPTRLSQEDARLAAFHLSRLVRLQERARDPEV